MGSWRFESWKHHVCHRIKLEVALLCQNRGKYHDVKQAV